MKIFVWFMCLFVSCVCNHIINFSCRESNANFYSNLHCTYIIMSLTISNTYTQQPFLAENNEKKTSKKNKNKIYILTMLRKVIRNLNEKIKFKFYAFNFALIVIFLMTNL